jgi:hypothetical protein
LTSHLRYTLNVENVNDAPVASLDTVSVTENQTLTINVLANDTDIDTKSIAVNIACPCKKLCICDSNRGIFIDAKGCISACGAIFDDATTLTNLESSVNEDNAITFTEAQLLALAVAIGIHA